MNTDRARRLVYLSNCDGWADLIAMLDEAIAEPKDEFYEMVSKNPEKASGKTGVKLGARARGLEDFKESILDARKVK